MPTSLAPQGRIIGFGLGIFVGDRLKPGNEGLDWDEQWFSITTKPSLQDPAEPQKKGGGKTKESDECGNHRARLLGDPHNKNALNDAWKRSQVGDSSKAHEEGGLLGLSIDNGQEYGPSAIRDLRRNVIFGVPANVSSAGMKGFTVWAQGQTRANASMVNYMYWYHTHPHDVGDIVPGAGPNGEDVEILGVDYPSKPDKGIADTLHLTGVLMSKTKIVVFNESGILCTFDR